MKSIKGIAQLINKYDVFIIDQWGVMHNGLNGYDHAIDCIKFLKKNNKKLIVVSNSSKRKESSLKRLPILGYSENDFDEILTSGEMIWRELSLLTESYGKNLINCFHIYDKSKEDGISFRNGLNHIKFVEDINESDFILGCTPFYNSKPIDYIPILKKAFEKKLIFFCANPDYETIENTNNNIYCMGTISELYREMGGEVIIKGKPDKEIYIQSTMNICSDKSKIIAIGDSVFHDIKGADNFGIDSVLISSGIHKKIFSSSEKNQIKSDNFLKKYNINPTFICENFSI